jgi:hypothetical protein
MSLIEYTNCDDFGTSTGFAPLPLDCSTRAAWDEADRRALPGYRANAFTQGFIHARQGRRTEIDMPDTNDDYRAGYAAAIPPRVQQ